MSIDITLYEFNAHSDSEKQKIAREYGIPLSYRMFEGDFYELFQVNNFYVEVHYRSPANELFQIVSFLNTTKLEPYLDQIDIDFEF